MALSHVRKHLDLQFVCGGCFSRSFLNGPALNKHMNACASVTRLPSVEPGDIRLPGCRPYAGGRVSGSYLHLLTYNIWISFMVLIVLKSK